MSDRKVLIAKIIDRFNGIVKGLLNELMILTPDDPIIIRANRDITAGIVIVPSHIIEVAGSQLMKFKSQIMSYDYDFFIAHNFEEHIKDDNDEKYNTLKAIISSIKKLLIHNSNKVYYMKKVRNMLKLYNKYLSIV